MVNTDEFVTQQTKILADLEYFESKGVMTKKEYIIKLKEVTRPLVLADYYPDTKLNDLCSLIGDLLEKYNIEYSTGHLAELFDEDEKRIQHGRNNSPDRGVLDSPPLPENKDEGIIGILDFLEKAIGKSYDEMPNSYDPAVKLTTLENIATKSLNHIKTFTKKLYTANYFVESFEKQWSTEQAEKLLPTLPKKQRERLQSLLAVYDASILLITEMEKNLIDISNKTIKEIQATQSITSKSLDERNKLTNWEKLTIWLAGAAEGIAKNWRARLNDIDKKHITNNIDPETSPVEPYGKNKHHEYKKWFQCITIKLDGKQYTFDISRWFDEQIERKKLDLEFKPLVVATADVK